LPGKIDFLNKLESWFCFFWERDRSEGGVNGRREG